MNVFRKMRFPRPDIEARRVPDRSGHEVAAACAHFGHDIKTYVYFFDNQWVLGALVSGTPGNLNAELREPLKAAEPVDDEMLGRMALDALLRFESRRVPSLTAAKQSDWPTFQASGARSVRAFQEHTVQVLIESVNGASLRLEATALSPPDGRFAVRAYVSISATHSEIGALLRKLIAAANCLKSNGMM